MARTPGVPVAMTSPGRRLMVCEMYETSAVTPKSKSEVLASCTTSPSTSQVRCMPAFVHGGVVSGNEPRPERRGFVVCFAL